MPTLQVFQDESDASYNMWQKLTAPRDEPGSWKQPQYLDRLVYTVEE